ncbi:phosphatidylinositol-glycan biosynthesis class F protein [Aplysia californica]|uniref:Phosphatidylinositol-glycan biosynthesis class F protein n=1 Tax=Aplysia californica TaxID=6500 RepID=A0ABM0JNM2_APLCA|nr:phosphatidylinositol-glycan biosynthesis class F protein [Aplysia californica]
MSMSKRYVIVSSISCFVSSAFVALFCFLITVGNIDLNIIANPTAGIKAALVAVMLQCTVSAMGLSLLFPDQFSFLSSKDSKVHFQVLNALKSGLILALSCTLFYGLAVCYGAPVYAKTAETFHFAALLTCLVCFPCCLLVGSSKEALGRIFFLDSSDVGLETVVLVTSVCSLLGAWLGAIPIPLDWDRPWQEWPVSCSLGALGGYTIGLFLVAIYLPRRYKFILKSKFT